MNGSSASTWELKVSGRSIAHTLSGPGLAQARQRSKSAGGWSVFKPFDALRQAKSAFVKFLETVGMDGNDEFGMIDGAQVLQKGSQVMLVFNAAK